MSQQADRRVDEAIPPWLERKKLLLIFDNCEHVVGTVGPIASAILRVAQGVRILATSRQELDIGGEKLSRLESLDVPHSIADLTPATIIGFGAVALFVDRASLVDKAFALTDDTAPIVADICRRLDGNSSPSGWTSGEISFNILPFLNACATIVPHTGNGWWVSGTLFTSEYGTEGGSGDQTPSIDYAWTITKILYQEVLH
jgi:hypothetical protein